MSEFVYEKLQSINRDWEQAHSEVLNTLSPEIADSWRRSFSFGVDADMAQLPAVTEQERSMAHDSRHETENTAGNVLFDFLNKLEEFLSHTHAVMLLANQSLRIFHLCGSPDIVKELASRNVAIGALLSERNVGTSALSLAYLSNDSQAIEPRECYCRLFRGFSSIARRISSSPDVYSLIMFPENEQTPLSFVQAEYSFDTLSALLSRHESSGMSLEAQVLNLVLRGQGSAFTVVDTNGKVITMDSRLAASLGDERPRNVIGMSLVGLFPSMAPLMEIAARKTKESRRLSTLGVVRFREKNYRIQCAPVLSDEGKHLIAFVSSLLFEEAPVDFNDTHSDYLQGASIAVAELKKHIQRAARNDAHVLLLGEAGTDKGRIAGIIHSKSFRSSGPFISVHCPSATHDQLRNILFGTEDNSAGKPSGAFSDARGGTLFLDEVDALPSDIQSMVVHVLEEQSREIYQGALPPEDSVRIIASSAFDLAAMSREGSMRTDLYYLLSTISIHTVPLRNRPEDIPAVLASASKRVAKRLGITPPVFTEGALVRLSSHSWPGNMRELNRLILRAHYEGDYDTVTAKDLPALIDLSVSMSNNGSQVRIQGTGLSDTTSSTDTLEQTDAATMQVNACSRDDRIPAATPDKEYAELLDALAEANGNKSVAARKLGITRQTLYNRIKRASLQ